MGILNKYDRWDKSLIALHKRWCSIDNDILDTAELVPLEKPVHHGYTYKLVIIDAPKYRDNIVFHAIIDATSDKFWVERKNNPNYKWRCIFSNNENIPGNKNDYWKFDLNKYTLQVNYLHLDDYCKLLEKQSGCAKEFSEVLVKEKYSKHYSIAYIPDIAKFRGIVRKSFSKYLLRSRRVYCCNLIAERDRIKRKLCDNGKNEARYKKIKPYRDNWEYDKKRYYTKKFRKMNNFFTNAELDTFMMENKTNLEYIGWKYE